MKKTVLIMAGGVGERLWPLSRLSRPKQFLSIGGEKSLIENTVRRAKLITDDSNIFIVTGAKYKDAFFKYLPNFNQDNIIFEPTARDTTAAITLGAMHIKETVGDTTLAILPADPIIKDDQLFTKTLTRAYKFASTRRSAVTIGIKPRRPDTGYGYIKMGALVDSNEGVESFYVEGFKEKPNKEKAEFFLEDASYLWNSGMFVWDINYLLETIESINSSIYQNVRLAYEAVKTNFNFALTCFEAVEKISFDFGIMEHIENIICVKGEFFWDDLGSFTALKTIYGSDDNDNTAIGNVFLNESKGNIIVNNDEKMLIALNNVSGITVVKSDDVIFIYKNGEDDKIKTLLKEIRLDDSKEKYTL